MACKLKQWFCVMYLTLLLIKIFWEFPGVIAHKIP